MNAKSLVAILALATLTVGCAGTTQPVETPKVESKPKKVESELEKKSNFIFKTLLPNANYSGEESHLDTPKEISVDTKVYTAFVSLNEVGEGKLELEYRLVTKDKTSVITFKDLRPYGSLDSSKSCRLVDPKTRSYSCVDFSPKEPVAINLFQTVVKDTNDYLKKGKHIKKNPKKNPLKEKSMRIYKKLFPLANYEDDERKPGEKPKGMYFKMDLFKFSVTLVEEEGELNLKYSMMENNGTVAAVLTDSPEYGSLDKAEECKLVDSKPNCTEINITPRIQEVFESIIHITNKNFDKLNKENQGIYNKKGIPFI